MSKKEVESYLMHTLKRLEKSSEQIISTRGYTSKVEKVKVLEELIKEQLINENTSNAARTAR